MILDSIIISICFSKKKEKKEKSLVYSRYLDSWGNGHFLLIFLLASYFLLVCSFAYAWLQLKIITIILFKLYIFFEKRFKLYMVLVYTFLNHTFLKNVMVSHIYIYIYILSTCDETHFFPFFFCLVYVRLGIKETRNLKKKIFK